jgi:hypothetical protein
VRLAFFVLQFFFILLVSCHDSFSIFSSSSTVFPKALDPFWSKAAAMVDIPLGHNLSATNGLRQILWAYLNTTGIDGGYSYFAPNVPDNYKIVFELRYPDGHTEFELPTVSGRATGLRLSTLLDVIAETEYDPLRSMMVKMLAYAVWQEHPEAVKVRAVLGYVLLPTPSEFRRGQKESYHFLFAYDFDFASPQHGGR